MPSLDPAFLPHVARLGLIAVLLALCFVVAARFRGLWGTTPLAVVAGLLQVPQTVLAIGTRVPVVPGVSISPGSVVFFPATLFAILLVYVLEDELEARRLVYGVLLANVVLAILIVAGQPLMGGNGSVNALGLDGPASLRLAWVLIAGTLVLAVDAVLLVRAFEWFGERVSRNLLARSAFALGLTAAFDGVAFSLVAFGTRPRFGAILLASLTGKVLAAAFYSGVFVFLLPWSRMSDDGGPGHRLTAGTGPITYKDRFQDLQKVAVRDALTGVFNRAYFDHELRVQAERALLRGDRLLLLMIDLDHFKSINDTHGHPAGDRVLSLFGEALRTVARQNDTVCRYGGEEFAMLISGGALSIAPVLFGRLRDEVARLWEAASPPLSFPAPRFSAGAASLPEDASSAAALLAAADRRLYAAKKSGRDRLVISAS